MAMLGMLFTIHCGLWIVVIVFRCVCGCFSVCLWLQKYPGFGLQLSCFGHVRAKNNSELPCGPVLCFTCWLGLSPVGLSLSSSEGCEGIVWLRVCSGWSSDCASLASLLMA